MTLTTRFPPSPTGYLHIGGLRTALYNYLLAKKNDGRFILRIEDTDRTRYVEDAEDHIFEMMKVFGIEPDESIHHGGDVGPYRQSDRLEIYQEYIQKLLEQDKVYYCFCSSERLDEVREKQISAGLTPKYDRHCRNLTSEEVQNKINAGEPHTIRLKVPDGEMIEFYDEIRGKISVPSADVDDQVLIKSDGFPTYHFCNVVDDYLMGVTHVMLGEEWIASGPKKKLIYDALGWKMPKIVYLPTILGKDRKKLSKRQGDVSAHMFLEKGFLVEAILNYIALIGWNPKTTEEFFTLNQMVEKFTIKGIQKASGIFDIEKMEWMNNHYISKMDPVAFRGRIENYLENYESDFFENTYKKHSDTYNHAIISELQGRFRTLADYPQLTSFFYEEPDIDPELFLHEKMKIESVDDAKTFLRVGKEILENYG